MSPDLSHQDGDESLHSPGTKLLHTEAVLIVSCEQPASHYPARVRSNIGL